MYDFPMDLVTDHLPEPVVIPAAGVLLKGTLTLPPYPAGVVLFAHGSGSSRFSRRNQLVANALVAANIGTLLFDLLSEREEASRQNVFDVELLAGRLRRATDWIAKRPATADLHIGFFGASTGAAAALVAAVDDPRVHAIVSRGGRPDLAGDFLPRVQAPTLLIVGGADHQVLALNRDAYARLACLKRLEIVPGATHLFEEPGTLESVAALARLWFLEHLGRTAPVGGRVEAVR
ncbi:MAG TPA: dienelactone hydrolase family protein [Gemmatimonadales bacterium]|jgi:putative phosphoribosyl transferase